MRGGYSYANVFPRMSLHCKLVPVRYREYRIGTLIDHGGSNVIGALVGVQALFTVVGARSKNKFNRASIR